MTVGKQILRTLQKKESTTSQIFSRRTLGLLLLKLLGYPTHSLFFSIKRTTRIDERSGERGTTTNFTKLPKG
jgi:hypothetical protein